LDSVDQILNQFDLLRRTTSIGYCMLFSVLAEEMNLMIRRVPLRQ
jgi:hypothetical protein